jgi:hypothetical protein
MSFKQQVRFILDYLTPFGIGAIVLLLAGVAAACMAPGANPRLLRVQQEEAELRAVEVRMAGTKLDMDQETRDMDRIEAEIRQSQAEVK